MNIKVSSKGGIIVTLKELVDMNRVGFKYKLNHRTKGPRCVTKFSQS
jgi:hypothetical protein